MEASSDFVKITLKKSKNSSMKKWVFLSPIVHSLFLLSLIISCSKAEFMPKTLIDHNESLSLVREVFSSEVSNTLAKNLSSNKTNDCHNCKISLKSPSTAERNTKEKEVLNDLNKIKESNLDKEKHLSDHKSSSSDNGNYNTDGRALSYDPLTTFLDIFINLAQLSNTSLIREQNKIMDLLEKVTSKLSYEIVEGVKIETINGTNPKGEAAEKETARLFEDNSLMNFDDRIYEQVRSFAKHHVVSINLPRAARFFGFRSFGLKKLLLPLMFGVQAVKSILLAILLPSILGSLGKILGKGLSQISTTSSQGSYPPQGGTDDMDAYNANKDVMGYNSDPEGAYAYPPSDNQGGGGAYVTANEVNDLSDVTLSRYGPGGAKVTYVPAKSDSSYYKGQAPNTNYKIFHKIPASSMILSNYDPFYSPVLSRLDGIFSRLGLAPADLDNDKPQVGGQSLNQIKLESCREQLICLMYASPAKYAPYSNLISAQLSRELNELRRPTSDNPEILRFFRYMRAARQGQEGVDCNKAHPACAAQATPSHTMIAAYQDINKLVSARKLERRR